MKKAIQFIIGAVAMEYSLVAACFLDVDGSAGNMAAVKFVAGAAIAAAMYYWSEIDLKRKEFGDHIGGNDKSKKDFKSIPDEEMKKLESSQPTKAE